MHLSLTRGFRLESLAMAAAVIPGTVVSLPERDALSKASSCVPSSDWCLQLAEILHSISVSSADRFRLKPSVFLTTLGWRCNLLSHLGATALLMPFCPSSRGLGKKKRQYFKGCVIRLKVEATQNQCWLGLSHKQTKTSQHRNKSRTDFSESQWCLGSWAKGEVMQKCTGLSLSAFGEMSDQHNLNDLLSSLVQVT